MNTDFETIDSPAKLRMLNAGDLDAYASWLRQFLIGKIAELGGHFAANLGVVELSIALHYHYNTPSDILIWDVGHQAYAHKILTGRKDAFDSLRKMGGISGFPKMGESPYDAFGTGHSSTSISAALGYAAAARLSGIKRKHIAVIGDGALSAGQAFEALNNAAESDSDITVIINDNHIGIDPSSGAMGEYLDSIEYRTENFFHAMGFRYFGPADGHNIHEMLEMFKAASGSEQPSVIHIRTVKGKGYAPAEAEQTKWHSTSKFDKVSGRNVVSADTGVKFQDVFGRTLLELASENEKIVAVTPAMISGSSLNFMQEKYSDRVFDTGIAEQHAVTFSAGLAASGMIPFCCIYSTFLQRGYDQLIHDVALQNLHVIFAVDRAGLVGEDGPTHHGVFDVAFLQTIPNLTIFSPRNQEELRNAVYTAVYACTGPVVIRYPRGSCGEPFSNSTLRITEPGISVKINDITSDIALISAGTIWKQCAEAINGLEVMHFDLRSVKPLDTEMLKTLFQTCRHIFIAEEAQITGGTGSAIAILASEYGYTGQIHCIGIPDHFIPHGSMNELYAHCGLDATGIRRRIAEVTGMKA